MAVTRPTLKFDKDDKTVNVIIKKYQMVEWNNKHHTMEV